MKKEVKQFVNDCLHCRSNKGARAHPRPLGETLAAQDRNEVLHMDYLFMKKTAKNKEQYILVLKDGFTGFTELVPCVTPDAATTVNAVLVWIARYGIPRIFVSDRATHFMNNVVHEVERRLGIEHHFTVSYAPWSNGTVERLNRDVLSIMRCLLSEAKLPTQEWLQLVPLVMSVINSAPRRNGVPPISAFCGFQRFNPLALIVSDEAQMQNVDWDKPSLSKVRDRLLDSIAEMHVRVKDDRERERLAALRRTDPTARVAANFGVGDFVLYTVVAPAGRDKLQARKLGPARIVEVRSEWVYLVENLITGEVKEMHAQRLEFYHDASLNVTKELREHLKYNMRAYEIDKLLDARINDQGHCEVLVKWAGFDVLEATWEDSQVLVEDACEAVRTLLESKAVSEECKRVIEAQLNAF